jgi:basic membrane protein A
MEAKAKFKVMVKEVEATDDNSFEHLLRSFAEKDFDLIIGIGFAQAEAIKKVSAKFPNKKFAIVDAQVDSPNVRSLLFEEHEGSYLVGAIAALLTQSKGGQSKKVGFIGGMDIPLIHRFRLGYEAGAKSIDPKFEVLSNFLGSTPQAWNDPPGAKEAAKNQYSKGVQVIFAAAGASGAGLFDAAEETKKWAIGCDSNQNWIKPGRIATSMLKRVDTAVFSTIEDTVNGKFSGGTKRFGLANQGVDFAQDEFSKSILTPEILKVVNELKNKIISGKIKVPDYYKNKNG